MDNVVMIKGTVPEFTQLQTARNGNYWCELVVVVTRPLRQGQQVPEEDRITVKLFGGNAEKAAKIVPGSRVVVDGRMESREYNGKYYLGFIGNEVAVSSRGQAQQAPSPQPQTQAYDSLDLDDDVPF